MSDDSDEISNPIEKYKELPDVIKDQLASIAADFERDESVIKLNKKYLDAYWKKIIKKYGQRHSEKMLKRAVFFTAIFDTTIPAYFLSRSRYFKNMECYNNDNFRIKLDRILVKGRHVHLLYGELLIEEQNGEENKDVVVKYYESSRKDTQFEVQIYRDLRKMKCPLPWFASSFKFWESPVLVLEVLEKLNKNDDEFQVAIDVMKALTYVHQIGVHNDIKPGNVMKKRRPDGSYEYLLIDYGGVANKRLDYGWRRWIWSPKWTSQSPHISNQVTTAKNDFLELGYTMKTLQNLTTKDDNIRKGFTGKLAKYMKRVKEVDPKRIVPKDYRDLVDILKS